MKGPRLPDTLAVPLGASAEVDCEVIDGDNLTLSVRASFFMEWQHYEDLIVSEVTGYLLKLQVFLICQMVYVYDSGVLKCSGFS